MRSEEELGRIDAERRSYEARVARGEDVCGTAELEEKIVLGVCVALAVLLLAWAALI